MSERARERLIQAAGEVFAERGFRHATVRDICRRANVNIASVSYYFKSKEELYTDVLDFAFRQSRQRFPGGPDPAGAGTPESRISEFIREFLARLLDEGRPAWFGKLMAREIVEPTGALDGIIEKAIRPLHQSLGALVREFLGGGAAEEEVRRHVFSILGQCLFYRHAKPVIERLYPDFRYDEAEIGRAARHIASVALSALKQTPAKR